jgi:hypothetical protein
MPEEQITAPAGEQQQAEAPRPSLREVAEATWDEAEAASPGEEEPPSGQNGPLRDSLGRFAAADQQTKPGEQSEDPAPQIDPNASGDAKPTDPAPDPGSSNQPPQHWSEQDRQTFAKLPKEGQEFLLRRHGEMERDYQSKAQASATAVQFTNALAPLFQHPAIAGSLQQANLSPFDAIEQWAGFHLRATHPDPQVKIALLQELAQRMGLDPAATGQMSQPGIAGLSEEDLKDPAIRSFADYLGKTYSDVQALRGEIVQMQRSAAEAQQAEVLKITRRGIDAFADEKDEKGNLKRPYFNDVMPHMIDLYRANPERDLQQAYDMACWAVPSIREKLIAAERSSVQQQASNEKARLAVRGNVRGITSPVSKPAPNGQAKDLRSVLEAAADEVGL